MLRVVVDQVEKVYKDAHLTIVALRSIGLTIDAGEFVVVTGESGAGKSTLLSMIGALDMPTRGRIEVDGQELTAMSASELAAFRLKNFGFVFQDFCLVRHLTAVGNVHLPLYFSRRLRQSDRAQSLLRRFKLGDRLHQRPAALSRGELQRVALARALVNEPRLLLADEPTANLDARNAQIVWNHLLELNQRDGLTIMAVTHSHQIAPGVTRILTLDRGELIRDEYV